MQETILITVTLAVPDFVKDQLNELKNRLHEKYQKIELLPEPHITLYQCKIPKSKIGEVRKIINHIADNNNEIFAIPHGVNIKNNYVGIAYEKSLEIENFHFKIVTTLNGIRGSLVRSTYVEKISQYSQSEQENINTYGYPYVLSEFYPHIALIKFENIDDVNLLDIKLIKQIGFKSPGINVIMQGNKKTKEFFSFNNR